MSAWLCLGWTGLDQITHYGSQQYYARSLPPPIKEEPVRECSTPSDVITGRSRDICVGCWNISQEYSAENTLSWHGENRIEHFT